MDLETLTKAFIGNFLFKPWPKIIGFTVKLAPELQLEKGTVIDLETTGLNPDIDDVIAIGILKGQNAIVHQLTVPNYYQFGYYAKVKARMSQLPRYGYNPKFEGDFLNLKDGWTDLTRYRERSFVEDGWETWGRMRLTECTRSVFAEPNIDGADVPRIWREWLKTKNPQTLSQITLHCLSDLLRTRQLIER